MTSTHINLYYHFIFSTKDRQPIITDNWSHRLHKYLGANISTLGGVPMEIGGVADHVHLLVGLRTTHQIAEFIKKVKQTSSQWVHTDIGIKDFYWQVGYGVFTVSSSQIEVVKNYILRQPEHHKRRSFQQEYIEFLEKHKVVYDAKYLW